jgi:lipoprotein signal peptidase
MQESAHAGGLINRPAIAAAGTAAVVFASDQILKNIFSSYDFETTRILIPHIIETVQHQNFGIIANVPLPRWAIVVASLIVITFVLNAIRNAARRNDALSTIALGILLGGALGNLYDRVVFDYVFDWVLLLGRSAVNLADAAIVIGAGWYLMRYAKKRRNAPPISQAC